MKFCTFFVLFEAQYAICFAILATPLLNFPPENSVDLFTRDKQLDNYNEKRKIVCKDLLQECKERKSLCNHDLFHNFMSKKCQKSCGLCAKKIRKGSQSTALVAIMPPPSLTSDVKLSWSANPTNFHHPGIQSNNNDNNKILTSNKQIFDPLFSNSNQIKSKAYSGVTSNIVSVPGAATTTIHSANKPPQFTVLFSNTKDEISQPKWSTEKLKKSDYAFKQNEDKIYSLIPTDQQSIKSKTDPLNSSANKCLDTDEIECKKRAKKCFIQPYYNTMRENCAKTCGFCVVDNHWIEHKLAQRKQDFEFLSFEIPTDKLNKHYAVNNLTSIIEFMREHTSNFDEIFLKFLFQILEQHEKQVQQHKSNKKQKSKQQIWIKATPNEANELLSSTFEVKQWKMPQKLTKDSLFNKCLDRSSDCAAQLDLCTHEIYWRLMRRVCARSCKFCSTENF